MLAVTLESPNLKDPLAAVAVGERDEPAVPDGWTVVTLRAASLNHHDVWNMRGVGVDPSWLPVVMGSDGAGVDEDGNEVIIYPLIASAAAGRGDETLDPRRRMISDGIDGTFAERVAVPRGNLIPKPASMSWETAAALPTAWLTAFRMLFGRAGLGPGDTVLVQGAGGGLSTALVQLGKAAGLRVWVTSRDAAKGERAVSELGADAWFESGARLPERVDAVMDSVGKATWSHSLKSLRPGGSLVLVGATSGADPDPDLSRIFLNNISVLGTAMGTAEELRRLVSFCDTAGIEPAVDSVHALADAREGIARMVGGEVFGKVIFRCSED
jgi:NADPH:quinone reductase-like Zn-dependent oxidoreductase